MRTSTWPPSYIANSTHDLMMIHEIWAFHINVERNLCKYDGRPGVQCVSTRKIIEHNLVIHGDVQCLCLFFCHTRELWISTTMVGMSRMTFGKCHGRNRGASPRNHGFGGLECCHGCLRKGRRSSVVACQVEPRNYWGWSTGPQRLRFQSFFKRRETTSQFLC